MSDRDPVIYGMPQAVSLPIGNVGIGSYIVNDYLITVAEDDGGNGYLLTIRKGSDVQTIHLTELTQEAVNSSIETALSQAKESGKFDGNGIESVVFNPDYTLSLYFTDGTSVTTGSIRGKEGNGIQGITMNPDYTLTITFTDGDIYTTDPIRGEAGKGISRIALNQDYTLTITYTDGTSTTTDSIRGAKGDTGNGISGVIFNDDYTLTINFTDGTSYRTESIRGLKGETGTGVKSAELNSDYTLTINLDDGTSYTTPSIRGQKGDKGDKGDPGDSFELHICSSVEYDHETRIPTIPYPRSNVLYLVPSEEGFTTDLFVEWAYIGSNWEKFGSASVNLDAYAKKTELNGKIDKPENTGLQGQVLTSDGSGGQSWSSAVIPDWNAASGTSGFIRNKPDLKAGTGTDSITNRHSIVSGTHSMATGTNNIVSGADNYVTGSGNNAKGSGSILSGDHNTAELRGSNSLVGGSGNSVSNTNAIAAGSNNAISGINSFATGTENNASGSNSSVSGENVIANHKSQTVSGEYNVSDPSSAAATARGNYVEIIGNGTADNARSNARTLDWNGNEWIKGNFKMGGNSYDDPNAVEVATKNDIVTPDWEAAEGEDGYIANKPVLWGGSKSGLTNVTSSVDTASGQKAVSFGNSISFNIYVTGDPGATTYSYTGSISEVRKRLIRNCIANVSSNGLSIRVTDVDRELQTITFESTLSEESAITNKKYSVFVYPSASGSASFSVGVANASNGAQSFATGRQNVVTGGYSSASGISTFVSGQGSNAMGNGTIANHAYQNVFGQYNVEDPSTADATARGNYVEIVGNGDIDALSNARTLDWSGNQWLAGNLKVGGTGYSDANAKEVIQDVTVNGASVANNGVAEIPVASTDALGLVKTSVSWGVDVLKDGTLQTVPATEGTIKLAQNQRQPIVPIHQHESAFYGLAKAAGDTTQASSSNAVGTYTDNAKSAIKAMLGVGGETQKVTVSGTAPVIVANQNTRYVCGEVVSLDFTPSAEGICDVIFTSGSTVTVLTIPNTVIFPEWFDPTALEANKTYEINITDGVYGAVMIW